MQLMQSKNRLRRVLLRLCPILVAFLCLGIGRYRVGLFESGKILLEGDRTSTEGTIILNIRLPRILLAGFVGAGLSAAGFAFQNIFRNPLASPDTLAVASGASFGAVLGLLLDFSPSLVQITSFAFGLFACLLTLLVGKNQGEDVVRLVLAGIIISSVFESLVSLLKYLADPQDKLPQISFRLMGSMTRADFKSLRQGLAPLIVGILIIYFLRFKLNILSLSEEEAKSLGVNPRALRLIIFIGGAMISSSSIAMCGKVGRIGLLIPHISRLLVGSEAGKNLPLSLSLGATSLIIIDTLARSISSAEIPLSIISALFASPIFIGLLKKSEA